MIEIFRWQGCWIKLVVRKLKIPVLIFIKYYMYMSGLRVSQMFLYLSRPVESAQ